jgi:hypothetical protein
MKYSSKRSYRDFEIVVESYEVKKLKEKTVADGIKNIFSDVLNFFDKIYSKFF